jgi:hypothetical protein
MNASTQSAIRARNPQFKSSRTPRIIAAVAAIIVSVVLFDGVALLGEPDLGRGMNDANATVVAQNAASTVAR